MNSNSQPLREYVQNEIDNLDDADINDLYPDLIGGYLGMSIMYMLKDRFNG